MGLKINEIRMVTIVTDNGLEIVNENADFSDPKCQPLFIAYVGSPANYQIVVTDGDKQWRLAHRSGKYRRGRYLALGQSLGNACNALKADIRRAIQRFVREIALCELPH